VHPNMNGTVVVGEGAGPPEAPAGSPEATGPAPSGPSEGGGDVTTEVVAQGIAFDVTEIVLPAGQESTIHFVNNDAGVQHNIVIATDPNLTEQLFSGELITGPTETDYTVPPLEPGEYYFLCIVHPNMNGIVTVR
jgi:plastocyanin